MLEPGDDLSDDLLGGRFRLVSFLGRVGEDGNPVPPRAWSDSPFLHSRTADYGKDAYILDSFDDPGAVRGFLADLLASRIPPFFLPAGEVRRPGPLDTPKPPEP